MLKKIILVTLLISFEAQAGNQRCGLGTQIWGNKDSISSQQSEISTNASSFGASSITTGTMGCSTSGLFGANPQEIYYANANFDELIVEMSEGQGEVLAGFTKVLGCNENGSSQVSSLVRKRYSEIYSHFEMTPIELLLNVKREMSRDPQLATECKAVVI